MFPGDGVAALAADFHGSVAFSELGSVVAPVSIGLDEKVFSSLTFFIFSEHVDDGKSTGEQISFFWEFLDDVLEAVQLNLGK